MGPRANLYISVQGKPVRPVLEEIDFLLCKTGESLGRYLIPAATDWNSVRQWGCNTSKELIIKLSADRSRSLFVHLQLELFLNKNKVFRNVILTSSSQHSPRSYEPSLSGRLTLGVMHIHWSSRLCCSEAKLGDMDWPDMGEEAPDSSTWGCCCWKKAKCKSLYLQ